VPPPDTTKPPAQKSAASKAAPVVKATQEANREGEIRAETDEERANRRNSEFWHLDMDPFEYGLDHPDWGMVYFFAYELARPFKNALAKERATEGTNIKPDISGDMSIGIGQVALLFEPDPVVAPANRAEDIAIDFFNVSSPRMQSRLSAPNRPITFSTVTRGDITVVNVNNPTVYRQFLQATEEGRVVLQPNEFVGSPPIRTGSVPSPDWSSRFLHAETQGELELRGVFDLSGPGYAWSFPNPGCTWCVPWIGDNGIVHMNPSHSGGP
jgi:hypothetical protein